MTSIILNDVQRINEIAQDYTSSPAEKLLALMEQAKAFNKRRISANHDKALTLCQDHFDHILANNHVKIAKTTLFKDKETSLLHEAYLLQENCTKNHEKMAYFLQSIEKHYPQQVQEADEVDNLIAKALENRQKEDLDQQIDDLYNDKNYNSYSEKLRLG